MELQRPPARLLASRPTVDQNLLRLLGMLALVFALMTALRPQLFFTPANFNSMMRQFPEYGIMSIGISLTMITGGIDLAVVGTANLSAIVAAKFLISRVPAGTPAEQVLPMLVVAVALRLPSGWRAAAFPVSSSLDSIFPPSWRPSEHSSSLLGSPLASPRAVRRAGCRCSIPRSATPSSSTSCPCPSCRTSW